MASRVVTAEVFCRDVDQEVDKTIDEHMVLHVHRGEGRDFVVLSAEDWGAIEETLYLNQIPGLADSIREAAEEPLELGTRLEDLEW